VDPQAATRSALWLLVSDLFLRVKLEALARSANRACRAFSQAADLVRALDEPGGAPPALVLVDLGANADAGFALLEAFGARSAAPPTLAYFSHVDEAAKRRAQALGATRIVPRSALVLRFDDLVNEVTAAAPPRP
jgi:DNA-binding NarL/FixJ family response regulator